jgi:prevent-host-death family protein
MRVSSAEFIRNFGSYSDTALSEPIVITKNGRDRLVLISIDEYQHLIDLLDRAPAEATSDRAAKATAAKPTAARARKRPVRRKG